MVHDSCVTKPDMDSQVYVAEHVVPGRHKGVCKQWVYFPFCDKCMHTQYISQHKQQCSDWH